MRILLIQPPHHHRLFTSGGAEPLGLESIAGAVSDHQVAIVDLRYDQSPLDQHLKRFKPQLVGITGYTVDVYNMRRILRAVKQHDAKTFTVVGGSHATLLPHDFNMPETDAIVLGLGEQSFRKLVESYLNQGTVRKVRGLALPGPQGLTFTAQRPLPGNLDDLPLPRRDLTRAYQRSYRYVGKRLGLISTARGCPHRCKFCSLPALMKGRYLTMSPERVLEELRQMPQTLIRFADGNTFGQPKRMLQLYRLIRDARIHKKFVFDMRSDAIVKHEDLVAKWSSIGLSYVAVGLESIRDSQLEGFGKGSSSEQNIRAIEILRRHKVQLFGQFIVDQNFGRQDFDELVDYVHANRIPFASYTILTPFPGTQLYDEKKEELLIDDYEAFDTLHTVLPTALDRDEFLDRFIGLYERTYTVGRYLKHLKRRLRHWVRLGEEPPKDLSLSTLLLIKLMMLSRLKKIRRSYAAEIDRFQRPE